MRSYTGGTSRKFTEFNYTKLGYKDFSIKKSKTDEQLYYIKYKDIPIIDAFDFTLGYKVKISCNGHKKTYPRFTFQLIFSCSKIEDTMFGPEMTYKRIDIFDGNHEDLLNHEEYKRLTEIVRLWSLELNSQYADDFDEYSFTGNVLITSSNQAIPIKDYISVISKFDFTKYSVDEREKFYLSIEEVKIDELLLQHQREKAVKKFELMLAQKEDKEK